MECRVLTTTFFLESIRAPFESEIVITVGSTSGVAPIARAKANNNESRTPLPRAALAANMNTVTAIMFLSSRLPNFFIFR